MTARVWQGNGTATMPVANGSDAASERPAQFSWEDWFRHASLPQRADALGLARQQGILYPHQLPATTNGVRPLSGGAKEFDASPLLKSLLAGKADALSRMQIEPLSYFDTALDEVQRLAVARAISTPDLFLLQGLPGTGKSRVLAEILLQSARRGWRVLFLAGQTASLDVVLQRLVGRPEVFALRFLDTVEKPEVLPAWLRGFTLEEQKLAFIERTLAGARSNHQQAESTCRQRLDEEPLWADLQTIATRHRDLQALLQACQEQIPRIAEAVQSEADTSGDSPFSARLSELQQSRVAVVVELDKALRNEQEALAQCERECKQLAARVAELKPSYAAKKQRQFWTLGFWSNLFNGTIIQEMESVRDQQTKAQANQQAIVQQIKQLDEQQTLRLGQFDQERTNHLGSEIQARQQALLQQQKALEGEALQLDERWHALCVRLDVSLPEKTAEAIRVAQEEWRERLKKDHEQCQFAHQWTKFLQDAGQSLAKQLPTLANVIAASSSLWHADAKLRDDVASPFDLLIVEDAETLTEADLLKLSRLAPRCVLIGQSLAEPIAALTVAEKAVRALLPAPLVSAACWNKLWQTLGGEAGCWPYTWHREKGRLVCQLMPLNAEDRQHLESEGLADSPDIELRILHRPRTQPCLAQVIFGLQCTFADAFTFMVREVQEFPLEPLGRTGWWSEDAKRHCRHLGANGLRMHGWLDIEPGVRLGIVAEHGEATRIGCIEFDKTTGWDGSKAEAWLHRHRPVHDHERTVFLQTPFRFQRPLAKLVQSVVRVNDWLTGCLPEGKDHGPGFEFVAVPPLSKPDWPREGAGLELDLSATRQADRLPVGLRQALPARGFANYLEAQALIRRLEKWSQQEASASCPVAVLALYEGQVELLRRLVEQSEILRARSFPLDIALPSRAHQREFDVVFLSLTRSHAHRCVSFGEDLKELPLALTRPRSRLIIFGDPGSICKRTTWHGPLDHHDAQTAQQELVRLSRLLACLQEHGIASPNGTANGRQ